MNIRSYPLSILHKYDVQIIPTLTEEDIPMNTGVDHPLISHLRMSLAPGGRSRIVNEPKMKILLWNFRGCNNPEFRHSFKDLVYWNNPSIICLIETKMQSHYNLMKFVNFTDLFELSADGYSGGASLM